MKFYVSTRFGRKKEVEKICEKLEKLGYENVTTWISEETAKPYDKDIDLSKLRATEYINIAKDCDLFILISDAAGTGMYVELGVAILSNTLYKKPKIYVIGEYVNRSMFFFHPSVKRFKTLSEVLEDLKN